MECVVSEFISQSIIQVIKLRRRGLAQKKASQSLDVEKDGYAKEQYLYLQEVPVAGMLIFHFLFRAFLVLNSRVS